MSVEKQYYDNAALWSKARFQLEHEQRRFATGAALIPPDTRSLLDIGAGNGAFLRYLEDQDSTLQVLGLERSQTAIDMKVCQADVRPGSADQLPFDERTFDMVSALEVIEHLPYQVYETTLRELERVARQYILLSVPYRENRRPVACPYCGCHFNPYYHMRRFDKNTLSQLFDDFQALDFVEVGVTEYTVMPLVRAVRALLRPAPFLPHAICPQCGYSQPAATNPAGKTASSAAWKSAVGRYIPKHQRRNWIFVLYQRKP